MLKITYYIFRQLSLTTIFLTAGLTAAIWLTQSLRFVDGVLNKGLPITTFFTLISYLLPDLISIVLPVSLLIAVIYAYNRLIADQELIVMRSAGMSHWQLAKPAILLASFITAGLYINNIYVLPKSYSQMRDMEHEMKTLVSSSMLQEGEFNHLNDMMVYVRKKPNKKDMQGILIYKNQSDGQPYLITAESGSLVSTPEGLNLVLVDGARQDYDKSANSPSMLYFDQYMVQLQPPIDETQGRRKFLNEYSIFDLLHPTESMASPIFHAKYISHGHQRLLNPIHAIAFTLIALVVLLFGQMNRRLRTKKIVAIIILAGSLQILMMFYIHMSGQFWITIPLSYITMGLAILIPFFHIQEWQGGHFEKAEKKIKGSV